MFRIRIHFVLVYLCVCCSTTQARSPVNALRDVCERHWELIYSHDEYGNATFGSKAELRKLAMTGNYVKANLYMPDHVLQLPADNINKRNGELCFQSLRALANNGTHVDNVNPWLFYMVCTTGHVTERTVSSASVFTVAIDWYIKDIAAGSDPVYSNFVNGSPLKAASIRQLHEAAQSMSLTASMRDRAYVCPLHNVVLVPETGEVNGQNILHIGQRYRDNYITFHEIPYKWFSHWSNLGTRDNARWSVQNHTAYNHNADNAAIDWYADICWRRIYINDANGFDVFGTVDDLIDAISRGHRVRVRLDHMTMEVSNMRVKDGVVAAQLLHEVTRVGGYGKDRYLIEANTKVKFSIVHTTGKVNSYEYLVGSNVKKINPPKRIDVEWMIDTRPWKVVLQTIDPPGSVLKGFVFDLKDAVLSGASIRFNVELDPTAGSFYTQANNIRADVLTDSIVAQAMDHFSDKKSGIPNEYELQKSIFHWYLMVSSEGSVRMSAWMFGLDTFRYDESALEAKVTWYTNL